MAFYVASTGQDFKPTPAGTHLARLYRIIDLGTQKSEFKGQTKFLRKAMFGWELFGEDQDGNALKTEDGKPMAFFKSYTASLSDKATLLAHLQSWRGREFTEEELAKFDISTVLGKWCMLNIIHKTENGKTYANLTGISPVMKIIKDAGLPAPVNKDQEFSFDTPDLELLESLSENMKTKIKSSPEWLKLQNHKKPELPSGPAAQPKSGFEDMDDDIPFATSSMFYDMTTSKQRKMSRYDF